MVYCGIDIASKPSYVYVTDAKGRKLASGEVPTTKPTFESRLKRYVARDLRIAIEAGNQTAWIYDALADMGAKVAVVNPAKVKLIAESRRKTDKIDAKILCELLRIKALPHPVHMPSQPARALRGLLVARRQLAGFGLDEVVQRGPRHGASGRDPPAAAGTVVFPRLAAAYGPRL